jgi:hypothetical protein
MSRDFTVVTPASRLPHLQVRPGFGPVIAARETAGSTPLKGKAVGIMTERQHAEVRVWRGQLAAIDSLLAVISVTRTSSGWIGAPLSAIKRNSTRWGVPLIDDSSIEKNPLPRARTVQTPGAGL